MNKWTLLGACGIATRSDRTLLVAPSHPTNGTGLPQGRRLGEPFLTTQVARARGAKRAAPRDGPCMAHGALLLVAQSRLQEGPLRNIL